MLGREMYVQPIFDRDRNEWWRMEVDSHPLFICARPEVLMTGRQGAEWGESEAWFRLVISGYDADP
jgi:hypothetical protein